MSGLAKLILINRLNSSSDYVNVRVICRNCLVKQQENPLLSDNAGILSQYMKCFADTVAKGQSY